MFKYLREQPRPDRHAGLLALGDPVYEQPDKSSEPKPPPDHGLLLNVVVRGSNAANHGLKDGDVLLAYNGQALNKKDDLKVVAEGDKPIAACGLERRPYGPARTGPRQARRDDRPPAGAGGDRGATQAGTSAGGGAVGRRAVRPLARHATRGRGARAGSLNPTIGQPGPCSVPTPVSPSWTAWPSRASWPVSPSSTWRRTGSSTRPCLSARQ